MDLRRYFEFTAGISPIILSCVHGGFKKPKRIPNKLKGPQIADKNTYLIVKLIINKLKIQGIKIYYILNKIHRSKVDLNRSPQSLFAINQLSIEAHNIHYAYHNQLIKYAHDCVSTYNRCLIIDIHGFTKPHKNYPDIIFGHMFGNTLNLPQNSDDQNGNHFWGWSQLYQELSKFFRIDNGLTLTDYNLAYSGGYITQLFYNKEKVNAIQIEVAKYIRFNVHLIEKFIEYFVKAILKIVNKV